MFKFRKYTIDAYIKFVQELVVDKEIKKEIISQINNFRDSMVEIDGKNLYGKVFSKSGSDYLEIRYDNNYLVCQYTDWKSKKLISITQIDLRDGNVKIDRKEKVEFKFNLKEQKNQTTTQELERIYNSNNELIYESNLEYNDLYNSFNQGLVYNKDLYWNNCYALERTWNISNGSIIKYKISKSYFRDNSSIDERYSICPGVESNYFVNYYNFKELDEALFKSFMCGDITIEKLLEENNNIQNTKQKIISN